MKRKRGSSVGKKRHGTTVLRAAIHQLLSPIVNHKINHDVMKIT
jgi:hypothetical protein